MRLFKLFVLTAALLDAALYMASSSSPLRATSPVQTIGLSADNSDLASLNTR